MQQSRFRRNAEIFLFLLLFIIVGNLSAQTAKPVPHLETARQLVRDLQHDAQTNEYGSHPTYLHWANPTREARTVCATFVTRLFEHTYGWNKDDIQNWLHADGADAVEWHHAIVHESGFVRLRSIVDVEPGDLLAIRYNDGSKDTGHTMLVDRKPEAITAIAPVAKQTQQYRVLVIDSSASGHGPTDTRHKADGGFTGGIGRGTIRLYARRDGYIVGYAWSETPLSKLYLTSERKRELAVGRLTRPPKKGAITDTLPTEKQEKIP